MVHKLFTYLDRSLKVLVFVLVMIMLVVGVLQIVSRYVLERSLPWSEELIRYCFVWTTMLCVPIGIHEGKHVCIDSMRNLIKGIAAKYYDIIIYFIEMLIFILLFYFGYKLAANNMKQLSAAMKLPIGYVIMSVPISSLLGVIYVIFEIIFKYKENV